MDPSELRSLHKGRERVIGGVCSGVAEYFMTDVVLVRLMFVILGLTGIGIVLYLLLWVLMPEAGTSATQGLEVVREGLRTVEADINRIRDELKRPAGTAAG
jgi:phage shock protein C